MINQKLLHVMLRSSMSALILLSIITKVFSPVSPVGVFEHHQDVGDPILKGKIAFITNTKF